MSIKIGVTILSAARLVWWCAAAPRPAHARKSRSAVRTVILSVDRKSKQVFLETGRNRIPINLLGELDTNALADQVQQKVSDKTHQDIVNTMAQSQAQQVASQHVLEQQVAGF